MCCFKDANGFFCSSQWVTGYCLLAVILLLAGCNATTGRALNDSAIRVGPQTSSAAKEQVPVRAIHKELEVIVPVFDPNIPEDSEEGIWPELRRVESVRFAIEMKRALEETEQLGAVRVTPDQQVTGALYVIGRINESNGEDVGINIRAISMDGKTWLSKNYSHRVDGYFFDNLRNKGKSAYYPIFQEAAADIVRQLKSKRSDYLEMINQLTEVRFGHSMSEDSFAQFLEFRGNQVKLVQAPASNDPMLKRIHKYRVEDQLFMDRMQQGYDDFAQQVAPSYEAWQEAAYTENKARREARKATLIKAVTGVLAIGLAVASDSDSTGGAVAETSAVLAGGALLASSVQSYQEAKFHQEALMELGQSVDTQVAPQVIAFEEKTIKLTGDMAQQFDQWRAALKRIYAEEQTPDRQL